MFDSHKRKTSRRYNLRVYSYFTIYSAYKYYKQHIVSNTKYDIDRELYRKICELFNKKIVEYIVMDSGEFQLPCRMGTLRIRKKKLSNDKKNLKINWPATNRLGKRVYYLNKHSKGYFMRYFWLKTDCTAVNHRWYEFLTTRNIRCYLGQAIFNNPALDYFE